jgi:hypothetical protein
VNPLGCCAGRLLPLSLAPTATNALVELLAPLPSLLVVAPPEVQADPEAKLAAVVECCRQPAGG